MKSLEYIVSCQLNRVVRDFKVMVYCAYDFPQVILNQPALQKNMVFSTPWWLTCPELIKNIHQLESAGYIKKLAAWQEKKGSIFLQKALKIKQELFKKHDFALNNKQKQAILQRGIAGQKGEGLKCLHAHYAFYLLEQTYPLGQQINNLLDGAADKLCGNYCYKFVEERGKNENSSS